VFWASMAEIRGEFADLESTKDFADWDARSKRRYGAYVQPSWGSGVLTLAAVNLLGLLLIVVRGIAAWVIGGEKA
jgi:hypothetical protein